MNPQRPTRRAALVAGLAGAASACGGAVIGLDPARMSLDIGNGAEPLTLDPHKASGEWENRIIGELFVGLMTEDAFGRAIPGMATRYETSEDGLRWTFFLRRAFWSDGKPCDAHDFEFAFKRILNPDVIAEYAQILFPILNAEACKSGDLPMDALGVVAIDDATLEIRLEHPAPYLPSLLRHYTTFPVPKHKVRELGDDWIKPGLAVSNGPYTLQKWWSNYIIHVERNPRFYDAANVAFRDLYFYPTVDSDSAMRRVRRGELAWSAGFAPRELARLPRILPGFARVSPAMVISYISFNMLRAPFNDKRVRAALSLAVDREQICKTIAIGSTPAYSFVPPNLNAWPRGGRLFYAAWPHQERLAEARRLLEEAGYGPQKPLRFTYSYRNSNDNRHVAVILQDDWRQIAPWVEPTVEASETQVHYSNLRARNFQMGDGGWVADFNDAKNFLYLLETRTGPQNYPGYSNAEFDRLMLASDQEHDGAVRAGLMAQAEQIMLDDHPVIPLTFPPNRNLVDPRLKGWEPNVEDVHRVRWLRL